VNVHLFLKDIGIHSVGMRSTTVKTPAFVTGHLSSTICFVLCYSCHISMDISQEVLCLLVKEALGAQEFMLQTMQHSFIQTSGRPLSRLTSLTSDASRAPWLHTSSCRDSDVFSPQKSQIKLLDGRVISMMVSKDTVSFPFSIHDQPSAFARYVFHGRIQIIICWSPSVDMKKESRHLVARRHHI
jgi:hypothetical protein